MGVSVWENHEDLELVGRAACQIPPPQVPGTDLDPCLLASDRPATGARHRSSPLFASIRPPPSRCLAPDLVPSLLASIRPAAGAWHQIQSPVC